MLELVAFALGLCLGFLLWKPAPDSGASYRAVNGMTPPWSGTEWSGVAGAEPRGWTAELRDWTAEPRGVAGDEPRGVAGDEARGWTVELRDWTAEPRGVAGDEPRGVAGDEARGAAPSTARRAKPAPRADLHAAVSDLLLDVGRAWASARRAAEAAERAAR